MANKPLEFDREILRQFQSMMSPQENFDTKKYKYCAEYAGCNGMYVHQAKALGWEIIQKDMPENPMMRDASGYCTMGDVIFMRMPLERYEAIERAQQFITMQNVTSKSEEEIRAHIDERVSKLVGTTTKASFEFKDRRDLTVRRQG